MNWVYGLIALWLIVRLINMIPRKMALDAFVDEVRRDGPEKFFKKWKNQTFIIMGPIEVEAHYVVDGEAPLVRQGLRRKYSSKSKRNISFTTFPFEFLQNCLPILQRRDEGFWEGYYDTNMFGFDEEIRVDHDFGSFRIKCIFSHFSPDLESVIDNVEDGDVAEIKGTLSDSLYPLDGFISNSLRSCWGCTFRGFILTNRRILAVYKSNGHRIR